MKKFYFDHITSGIYWNLLKSISLCNLWRFFKRRHKSKKRTKIDGNRFSWCWLQYRWKSILSMLHEVWRLNHVDSRHSISNAVLCTSATRKVILRHFPTPIVYKIESSYKIRKNTYRWFKLTYFNYRCLYKVVVESLVVK